MVRPTLPLLVVLAFAFPVAGEVPGWLVPTRRHLESLERDDGGYAWPDQGQSHLTTTYAVLGSLRVLGAEPPAGERKGKLVAFLRTAHPQRGKKPEHPLHEFDFQQIQSMVWLAHDPKPDFDAAVRAWQAPTDYPPQYESHRYPPFGQTVAELLCHGLLGHDLSGLPKYAAYVDARRRADGSFNNTPAADGSGGHVLNTYWGLRALAALGREQWAGEREKAVAWLRSCQQAGGHFAYAPGAAVGAVDDVIFTWAAVRSLKMLGAAPGDPDACVRYIHTLLAADGGFGDRPGWPPNPLATFYALETLQGLGALKTAPARVPAGGGAAPVPAIPDGLRAYTIQIEAPGKGSPSDAVELARALGIHLWGAKNATPAWIARAQKLAEARKVPVTFFVANEEYGTFMAISGQGVYSHMSDPIAPAGADFGASLAGRGDPPTWAEFLARRLAPLERAGGRMVWQFGENEPLCRMLLDESVERLGRPGERAYAAVSTFHFGNPDFTLSQPFLWHYLHRLPMVALQDNHAAEPWFWGDQLEGFRTLFLARAPTWEGWLEALRNNWVVAVRHDAVTGYRTRMHGPAAVRAYAEVRRSEWQWWSEPAKGGEPPKEAAPAIARPALGLAVLTPEDELEAGRPEAGVALRLRRQWQNTTQGLLKKPAVEIVTLSIDGRPVVPKMVRKRAPANRPAAAADEYFLLPADSLAPGSHALAATLHRVAGEEAPPAAPQDIRARVEFVVPGK